MTPVVRSAPALKVMLLDVSETVVRRGGTAVPGIGQALRQVRAAGVKLAFVGNERTAALTAALTGAGIPYDAVIGSDSAGAKKPSPRCCQVAGQMFGAAPHEMIYVGDNDATDALCAVNAHVLYLAALWANPAPRYGLAVADPEALVRFTYRFLIDPPRWYWTYDRPDRAGHRVHVRGLFHANRDSNNLKAVLKYDRDLRVEGLDYWGFLIRRMLTAIVLEGLHTDVETWTWFPSSSGAPPRGRFTRAFDLWSRIFRGRHVPDLIVRHTPSTKSAKARSDARIHGTEPPRFVNQVSTMQLNPAHRTKVVGKHVLVADDFCTQGLSFEWARNLLFAAGARDVTLVAIGRFWKEYHVHTPKAGVVIDPWRPSSLGDHDFDVSVVVGDIDQEAGTEHDRLLRLHPPGTTPPTPGRAVGAAESPARRG